MRILLRRMSDFGPSPRGGPPREKPPAGLLRANWLSSRVNCMGCAALTGSLPDDSVGVASHRRWQVSACRCDEAWVEAIARRKPVRNKGDSIAQAGARQCAVDAACRRCRRGSQEVCAKAGSEELLALRWRARSVAEFDSPNSTAELDLDNSPLPSPNKPFFPPTPPPSLRTLTQPARWVSASSTPTRYVPRMQRTPPPSWTATWRGAVNHFTPYC